MLLAAAAAAASPASAEGLQRDATSGCRVLAPRDMPSGAARWIGTCAGGLAQGAGVLRMTPAGARAPVNFYGSMRAGRPVQGVIEHDGGWLIGQFRDGVLVQDDDDPDAGLKQFRSAVEGARVAARRFAAQGNAASAAFYRAKADVLDETSPGGH